MKYFFILGNNKALSLAEILAIFSEAKTGDLLGGGVFVFETKHKIDAEKLIKKIGGTIKIGVITKELHELKKDLIIKEVRDLVDINEIEGKFKFGFSSYGKAKINTKQLAMELKKYLQENSISCRWVTSRESTLSSVVVEQNKLINKGLEVALFKNKNKILIGKTLAVQPFKELSKRDYGRPARDDKSGMLPPKLAQIMINLAGKSTDKILLDPFCGSGTVITEAMLLGYDNLIGADVSKKAVTDTKKNIEWIQNRFKVQGSRFKVINMSVVELSKIIKQNSIDVIVTEPYLGPQSGYFDINKIKKELEKLYSDAINEFRKILKKDGVIVMLWPVFQSKQNQQHITPDFKGFKIVNPLTEEFSKKQNINLTNRNTIVYGREGQRVWREIVIMKHITHNT